jgi:hypothetical protein
MRTLTLFLVLSALLASCNIPGPAPTAVNVLDTAVAATLTALPTSAVPPPTAILPPTSTLSIPATATSTPVPVGTPSNPLVVKDALCWVGPGAQYLVVSAVFNGTRVVLLGRGSVGSWWVIENPRYHDPCWVAADVLQFDAGYNLSGLKVFTPPPTPTPTPTNTPTPSKTPTP